LDIAASPLRAGLSRRIRHPRRGHPPARTAPPWRRSSPT